jgi:hypothetical protein
MVVFRSSLFLIPTVLKDRRKNRNEKTGKRQEKESSGEYFCIPLKRKE